MVRYVLESQRKIRYCYYSYDHMTKYVRKCANLKVRIENPTSKKNILQERGVFCAHHCVNRLLVRGNPWELVLKPPVCSSKLSLNFVVFMFYNSELENGNHKLKYDRTQPAVWSTLKRRPVAAEVLWTSGSHLQQSTSKHLVQSFQMTLSVLKQFANQILIDWNSTFSLHITGTLILHLPRVCLVVHMSIEEG